VGRTASAKGLGVALQVVRRLRDGGLPAQGLDLSFDVLGDGPERPHFERQCGQLELASIVRFHGWVAHERVCEILRDAHFILLPSQSEGGPKVLSEAMAYGVVPISSRVSAIPQILAEVGSGAALPPDDVSGYVQAIHEIVDEPGLWRQMVNAGLTAAPRFTFERYLMRLDEMLTTVYDRSCFDRRMMAELRTRWREATAKVLDTGGGDS
jgi:glycosyltransferase involved in cell wall biosynthesis